MSQIKFRAWDKDRNKMFDVQAIYFQQDKIIVSMPVKIKGFEQLCVEKTNVELMQYTGFKDNNGKEIYEGDILTSKYYPFQDCGKLNYNAEVFWRELDGQWCIELHCVNPEKAGISDGMCESLTGRGIEFEIIGNIYENTKFLEVGGC